MVKEFIQLALDKAVYYGDRWIKKLTVTSPGVVD